MFCTEFCETFDNTFDIEQLLVAAFEFGTMTFFNFRMN